MQLRVGFEMLYEFIRPTPMVLMVDIHPSREQDVLSEDGLSTDPAVAVRRYMDSFGNRCRRILAPTGQVRITNNCFIAESGIPDPYVPGANQHPVEDLPDDTLVFLLGSRYCETDVLSQTAWNLFGHTTPGWQRVQTICDYVHDHIRFDYQLARPTRTAWEAFNEQTGVCRDYAHLALTFCRAMNIPARYCTGYVSDIGMPPPYAVGDFAAWIEVFLGGAWHTFDPRNNERRIGRILMARGRDAADVAITTSFGSHLLTRFDVWTEELHATGA